MADAEPPDETVRTYDLTITPSARAFLITTIGVSLAAFNLGFDLGAFDNVDHRKFWAAWVVCTVALVASFLYRDVEFRLSRWAQAVLLIPSLWLLTNLALALPRTLYFIAVALTMAALPIAFLILARALFGDFFTLTRRLRIALVVIAIGIFTIGWFVGNFNDRFLTCWDFERAGEFQPRDCEP